VMSELELVLLSTVLFVVSAYVYGEMSEVIRSSSTRCNGPTAKLRNRDMTLSNVSSYSLRSILS
jgi:hypothetical protein